jgi:hypothetical protein
MPDEGLIIYLNQFTTIIRLSSTTDMDMVHIDRLTKHIMTLDSMLKPFYDPEYREARARLVAQDEIIKRTSDNAQFFNLRYALCLSWIGAISALMRNKNWIGDPGVVATEDVVDQDTYVADERTSPDMVG